MQRTGSAIGIDIGGTRLRGARVGSDGAIEEHVGERIARDPASVMARVVDLVRRLDRPGVLAVGAGIPGRVDARRRIILSGGYIDLSAERFAETVEAAIGKLVAIDNDGNMALAAEVAVGAGRGREHVVMFTIGTGIGGAVMIDGKMIRGRMSAGQLGHLTVDVDGRPCACGRQGCVETTSSGTALARLIAAAGMPPETLVEDLFRREASDEAAAALLLRWIRPLRAAIDSAVAAFAPDLVLLGGALGQAAHRALAKAPPRAAWFSCPVEPAALGDDAGVIGSALTALSVAARDDAISEPTGRPARDTTEAGRR